MVRGLRTGTNTQDQATTTEGGESRHCKPSRDGGLSELRGGKEVGTVPVHVVKATPRFAKKPLQT